jgi:hypothetical protein
MIKMLLAVVFSMTLTLSNAIAEEVKWLNTYKFIGDQNVKVSNFSNSSPVAYPGSIVVYILPTEETSAKIFKRIKIEDDTALTSVTICFRDFESTQPFGINIYSLGLPTDEMTVEEDEELVESEILIAPEDECTTIALEPGLVPEDENLLFGIVFDLEGIGEGTTAGIISAVGLGMTSTMLEIDGCDTGVPDIDVDGTPLSELIDECAVNAKNHGKFVSCVNKVVNPLKKAGIITGKEKGQITKCAAQSDLP